MNNLQVNILAMKTSRTDEKEIEFYVQLYNTETKDSTTLAYFTKDYLDRAIYECAKIKQVMFSYTRKDEIPVKLLYSDGVLTEEYIESSFKKASIGIKPIRSFN